ncbi:MULTISPECIES: hypothetical protein [Actinomadura]|uniref:Uncharacterized protein n=2 Tax=Actinomadura yumaensis TaxID=111807 RepID=A0ABW2CU07_9ACTN|nr:hypothetical protein [Actinomadura sp. J1-007]
MAAGRADAPRPGVLPSHRAGRGKRRRLAYLIERYGEAIEADLALGTATTTGGWDLAGLVRRRRYRFVLNLIDSLPSHSRTMAAIADDDEVAAQMDLDAPPRPPSLTEFDPTTRAVADLYDRVGVLIAAVVASTGKKPPRVPPYRRPRLAIDRLRERTRWTKHKALTARLLRR